MKKVLFILLVVVCSVQVFAQDTPNSVLLEAPAFQEQMKETPTFILLDVRSPEEFKEGHLPGAVNIDWFGDDFTGSTSHLDKQVPVFVYCEGGGRSGEAAREFQQRGFTVIYDLEGGFGDWKKLKMDIIIPGAD